MADEEDIAVTIEEEKSAVETEKPAPGTDPVEELRAQKAELEAQAEREKQRADRERQRAEQEARGRVEAEREAQSARTEVTDSRLAQVEGGLSNAKTEADAAEAAYTQALQEGNFAEAAKQQRRMARAEAEAVRLNEAKADLEVQKLERPAQRRERQPVADDPVEAFIASRDDSTQTWLRAHMDDARVLATGSNPRRAMKLNAADADAVAEGFDRGSKAYFAHVEKFLGMTQEEAPPKTEAKQRRSAAPPVAPVGNGSASTENAGGTVVRLTPGEARAAVDGTVVWNKGDLAAGRIKDPKLLGEPVGHTEFARRKKAMTEQGLYDKAFTEG